MRTTVTLDPDVVERLKSLARRKNQSFKVVLNEAIRVGLAQEARGRRRFEVESRPLGLRLDLTNALQLVGDLEDAEIIRKMQLPE
jgi:hypothetical protein